MLTLLFVALLSAGVLSQPLKENCKTSEHLFRDCLRKIYQEREPREEGYIEGMKKAVDQCRDPESACLLQNKLSKKIEDLLLLRKTDIENAMDAQGSNCYNKMETLYKAECQKTALYDKHGFMNSFDHPNDAMSNYYVCLAEHSKKSEHCRPEDAKKILFGTRAVEEMKLEMDLGTFFASLNGKDEFYYLG